MPFAAALSAHPVSSHATGEVVGRLFEEIGPEPDLLVLLATPGHRGALEDIVATARRLLSPAVLLAAVTTGLGAGDDCVEQAAGLAAWCGTCGEVAAMGAGTPPFEVTGALVLGAGPTPPGGPLAGAGPMATTAMARRVSGRHGSGVPVVAGTVSGPVCIDGSGPGAGPVGVVFGPASGFDTAVALGLRPVGPGLRVTRADGPMVYELDGRPALDRLVEVARDGVPASELPTLGRGLHLVVAHPGGAQAGDPAGPLAVLGADRHNGALALGGAVDTGARVAFAVADPAAVRTALGRILADRPGAAVVLAAVDDGPLPGGRPPGRHLDVGVDLDGFVDPVPPLPPPTLICATSTVGAAVPSSPALPSATVACFSPTGRRR